MANLQTLQGISDARESLYSKLEEGAISEQRANVMERVLKGQTQLKGELPLKAFKLVAGNKKFEAYAGSLVDALAGFVGQKALTE